MKLLILLGMVSVVTVACSAGVPVRSAPAAALGQWLQFRGDRALTGRSPLKGSITSPAVKWKQFVGARETLAVVDFGDAAQSATLDLPRADLSLGSFDGDSLRGWTTPGPGGTGEPELLPGDSSARTGKLLRGEPDVQKVEFESGFSVGANLVPKVGFFGRLYTRANDQWVEVWKSPPISLLYAPNPIVGAFDLNNDGKTEFVILADIVILSGAKNLLFREPCGCARMEGRTAG